MPDERTVHVVDDDPAFLRSMEALLDSAGFATRLYESAPAVLNAASQLSGGCMLLDVQMPNDSKDIWPEAQPKRCVARLKAIR
jgi:two-component system, LuxR family, response regulator FixJ